MKHASSAKFQTLNISVHLCLAASAALGLVWLCGTSTPVWTRHIKKIQVIWLQKCKNTMWDTKTKYHVGTCYKAFGKWFAMTRQKMWLKIGDWNAPCCVSTKGTMTVRRSSQLCALLFKRTVFWSEYETLNLIHKIKQLQIVTCVTWMNFNDSTIQKRQQWTQVLLQIRPINHGEKKHNGLK